MCAYKDFDYFDLAVCLSLTKAIQQTSEMMHSVAEIYDNYVSNIKMEVATEVTFIST